LAQAPRIGYNAGVPNQTTHGAARRIACLTLDIEADHHDLTPLRHYEALEHQPTWQWLLAFSQQRRLPWTAFIVGELLDTRPSLAARLAATGWELGLHSYCHDPGRADALDEIQRGKEAFRAAFGHDPAGYRAPVGKITPAGLARLRAEGFHYDASVFPTWHPGKSNHLAWPVQPFLVEPGQAAGPHPGPLPGEEGSGRAAVPHPGPLPEGEGSGRAASSLVEIPFAVLPRLRLIVSVSFVKLLGIPTYRLLLGRLGLLDVAVIDCHMHDLAPAPAAMGQLPRQWQLIYRRNQDEGRAVLTWLVEWLSAAGYEFGTVGAVAALVRQEESYA
jgi:hypothetical protein